MTAEQLRRAQIANEIALSDIARRRPGGRPLKPGRTEPGVSVRARVERFRLADIQRITGRSISDVVEIGLCLVHAHLTNDAAECANIINALTKHRRAC